MQMQDMYTLLGLFEDIKKAYIDTYVEDAADIKPSLNYSAWINAAVLWMPGWGSHVEVHAPDKADPFIVKTDSAGLNPAMRALSKYLNEHHPILPVEMTSRDNVTYELSHTKEGFRITIVRNEIPDMSRVPRKTVPQKDTITYAGPPTTHAPNVPVTTIVAQAPSMWDAFPKLNEMMKEVIETQADSIPGVRLGYSMPKEGGD